VQRDQEVGGCFLVRKALDGFQNGTCPCRGGEG
jgi:hypothetical protein